MCYNTVISNEEAKRISDELDKIGDRIDAMDNKVKTIALNDNSFKDFFESPQAASCEESQLLVDKYGDQLNRGENRFYEYKNIADQIIDEVSKTIHHTVITKGAIHNFTPFYSERLGDKLNGKVINDPVSSDYCRKYHYDSSNRPVIVEEYSVFLGIFRVEEVYLYHDGYTEKLLFSSGILERGIIRKYLSTTKINWLR